MKPLDRRSLLRLGVACAALPLVPDRLRAADDPPPDVVGAWQRLFSGPAGSAFAWWQAGTLYAHVDGLREFPIVTVHAVTLCRAVIDGGAPSMNWRTLGFFGGLEREGHTTSWQNPFTGKRQEIPARFEEGPGRYRLQAGAAGEPPLLSLSARNVRVNRTSVTTSVAEGLLSLSQIEGSLQGFPGLDGALPPLESPRITERQTRLQVFTRSAATTPTTDRDELLAARGFFNHVYDALPDWLGFGDRLGSALSKGVMRKAATHEVIDTRAWSTLRRLHPRAFAGTALRVAP